MTSRFGARWSLPGEASPYLIVWWYDKEAQDTDRRLSPFLATRQLDHWIVSNRPTLREIGEELEANPTSRQGSRSSARGTADLKQRIAAAFQTGTLVALRSGTSTQATSGAADVSVALVQGSRSVTQHKQKQVTYYQFEVLVPANYTTLDQMYRLFERTVYGKEINIPWSCGGYCDMAKNAGKVIPFLIPQEELEFNTDPSVKQQRAQGKNAYEQLPDSKRRAITTEIDRRYYEKSGDKPGTQIKKGQPGKALMWQQQQAEVMQEHQRLEKLPPQLKELMTGGGANFQPKDYQQLLRIAEKLKQFTAQDLSLFKMVAVRTTHDLDLFERSVDLFLARKEELRRALENLERRPEAATPDTMEAAIDASWDGVDLSKVGKMSRSDQYALARRQTWEATKAQLAYMGSHPGEVAADFAKTATLMNTGETFAAMGKDLAEAANGDANSWARWAAGFGTGAKLSGWLLAVGGVLYVLSWLTGAGELATIAAVMGRLLISAIVLSTVESELRIVAASQAKTPEEFKQQVNKAAAAQLNALVMLAMLGLAWAMRFVAKTFFPKTVKSLQTTLARLRERVRLVGRLADKKAAIATEMRGHRSRLEQAGKAAKDAAKAQANALEGMTLDEFIAKMESGALLPEAKLQEGQKIPWKQLAGTPEGLKTIEGYQQRLVSELRSEVLNEIDALIKEQTDAIDATLDKISKATTPEELGTTLKEHEDFLKEDEVAARGKVREQRALQKAAADALGFKDIPPPELRTLAETLRRPITETDPAKARAKRLEIISELRNVHGAVRPPKYEGYVFDKILEENQAALARSRVVLHSMNLDVIVGMERGGSFLTDALVEGDPVLSAKVRKMQVHPALEGSKGKYDGPKMQAEFQKLINGGAKKIVVYDAYMGGRTARSLVEQVFKPLANKNPGVTFQMYWLRETFGLRGADVVGQEDLAGSLKPNSPYSKSILPPRVENVTLVLGDDMDVVMSPNGQESIRIFNSSGNVTEVVTPKPGQTTRQVLIKRLNRSSSPSRSPGGSGGPVVPAPPNTRPKND